MSTVSDEQVEAAHSVVKNLVWNRNGETLESLLSKEIREQIIRAVLDALTAAARVGEEKTVGDTLYLDRTRVRCIIMQIPDEHVAVAEDLLMQIDALPIITAPAPLGQADDGWVLVPRRMQMPMMMAGNQYLDSVTLRSERPVTHPLAFRWHDFWTSMLAAAPEQPK